MKNFFFPSFLQKGKKIFIYLFLLILVGSINNFELNNYKIFKIRNIDISGLNNLENLEEKYETINNEEDHKSTIDMPPQRNIRDAQPTISVNYRVVKNTEENNLKRDRNFSNNTDIGDDWDKEDNDW